MISMYFNKYMSSKLKALRKEKKKLSDIKANDIQETLSNAKMLKLYSW